MNGLEYNRPLWAKRGYMALKMQGSQKGYVILEWWANGLERSSLIREGDEDTSNVLVFDTKEDADNFAKYECAYNYQVIEIK